MKRLLVWRRAIPIFFVLTIAAAVAKTPPVLAQGSGPGLPHPNDLVAPPSPDMPVFFQDISLPDKFGDRLMRWRTQTGDVGDFPFATRSCPDAEGCESQGTGGRGWENSLEYQTARPSRPGSLAAQATGGPDEFGYRWDDGVPLNWIDASGGTDTGISNNVASSGAIEIGFPFKFYEHIYTRIFVSRSGFLTFDSRDLQNEQSRIPSEEKPNDVVAPHWSPIHRVEGYVRYRSGGVAPNRWFVVEWNRVVSDYDGPDEYTFEVVLHENSNMLLQYGEMIVRSHRFCEASGIEDSRGLDGFSITDFCTAISAWHAVSIIRPPAQRRVLLWPKHQGQHAHAGELVKYDLKVCNGGDLGSDTFDFGRGSAWPLALYKADGVTPLSDTNSNGVVDTGSMPQGDCTAIMAHTLVPADADIGRSDQGIVTASSSQGGEPKTAVLQTAVPAAFAQVYRQGDDNAMSLYLAKPGWQITRKATANEYFGSNMAVAETPAGTFAYTWVKGRWLEGPGVYVYEIEYALLGSSGSVTRAPTKLADHSDAISHTYDETPSIAVAANGRIGLFWRRTLWNPDEGLYNINLYFAVLNASGAVAVAPINLTNSTAWEPWDGLNAPRYHRLLLAATTDSRFVLAWHQTHLEINGRVDGMYFAIRNSDGGQVRGATLLTNDTPGESGLNGPVLTSLTNARVYFSWRRAEGGNDDILYAILDSSGDVVKGVTDLSQDETVVDWYNWDAVQLSNGRIVAVWEAWGCFPGEWFPRLRFAVLDQNYNRIGEPKCLGKVDSAKWGDIGASITADATGRAVITWIDAGEDPRHLNYALVDGSGQIITLPMIFRGNQANPVSMLTNYEGFGNTGYHWQPPDAVDGYLAVPAERPGARGGFGAIPITFGNNGARWASLVVLEATLANGLAYDSDTSGVAPAIDGNRLRWSLPGLSFLSQRQFTLYLRVAGDAVLGGPLPVAFDLTSAGPEANPADNSATTQVMVGPAPGGPDDFGYTWDDGAPFNWLDATLGVHTGLSTGDFNGTSVTDAIDLGFNFKFYAEAFSKVYIASSGTLGFDASSLRSRRVTPYLPSPADPNAFIAPYLAPLLVNAGSYEGRIYYLRGGAEPNRFFVAQWEDVTDGIDGSFTFQVVLRENGDILFQYLKMAHPRGYFCETVAGIEGTGGQDGLALRQSGCNRMEDLTGKAVLFHRPSPSARVQVFPIHQGSFTRGGETNSFRLPIRNTGDLGNDVYDLNPASGWPVSLYEADGVTPLVDSDADGIVDTRSVAQGAVIDVVVKVQTPGGEGVGAHNNAVVTVRSSLNTAKTKNVTLRTAVPAPFAQAYTDTADGAMSLYLVQPAGRVARTPGPAGSYGGDLAITETPGGRFVYVWSEVRCLTGACTTQVLEIKYALVDRYGQTIRAASKLVDHSGAGFDTYDYSPAIAAAPDGRTGVFWRRQLYDRSNGRHNDNLFFAVLDASGNQAVAPVNLTNNTNWGESGNRVYLVYPHIAATHNSRFVLAWWQESLESGGWVDDIYVAIRDSQGQVVRDTTRFSNDTPGYDEGFLYPGLASVGADRILLTWTQGSDYDIHYAVLDDSGSVVRSPANLVGDGPTRFDVLADAALLTDGRTVVAWMTSSDLPAFRIRFAVLNSAFERVAGPTAIDNPAGLVGDGWVSVTAAGNAAVLTWMDYQSSYAPNLYYALVDGNGHVLTTPTIFRTSQAISPAVQTSFQGYGNTTYSWQPPTSVDGIVAFGWAKSGAEPGGAAVNRISLTNHGAVLAANTRLTLTLDPALAYLGDTSGVTPTIAGDTVTWNLPDLSLLEERDFTLHMRTLDDAGYGEEYPISITLSSAGPEGSPGDNTATAVVEVQRRLWLPLLIR